MTIGQTQGQVVLAEGYSALALLHTLLLDAVATYPESFEHCSVPVEGRRFRSNYAEVLPVFEAARLASVHRYAIAQHMVSALQEYIIWQGDNPLALHEALLTPAQPLVLRSHQFDGDVGWPVNMLYHGERYAAEDLAKLGAAMTASGMVSKAASDALAWVAQHGLHNGVLNLSGRKIAVLGGGAEMAPTRLWLEAGADVLWLDTQPPPESWWETPGMAGRLTWSETNADLLSNPQAVLSTLIEFANNEPIDIGLYAYAPGQARELRLTASMNAVVNALSAHIVGSVTILVSPTTPTELSADDVQMMQVRAANRPGWEKVCAGLGLLGSGGGSVHCDSAQATRTVVSIQGASYQAAQYLGKVLMAETWANFGQLGQQQERPIRVSANTAAITRTRSLAHPVFTAAFGGAAALQVETLVPRQSRRLNGLLAVHDWLHPQMPKPGAIRVHGGIHTFPYPLEKALRVAAAIGFVRSPRLLKGLVTG